LPPKPTTKVYPGQAADTDTVWRRGFAEWLPGGTRYVAQRAHDQVVVVGDHEWWAHRHRCRWQSLSAASLSVAIGRMITPWLSSRSPRRSACTDRRRVDYPVVGAYRGLTVS